MTEGMTQALGKTIRKHLASCQRLIQEAKQLREAPGIPELSEADADRVASLIRASGQDFEK